MWDGTTESFRQHGDTARGCVSGACPVRARTDRGGWAWYPPLVILVSIRKNTRFGRGDVTSSSREINRFVEPRTPHTAFAHARERSRVHRSDSWIRARYRRLSLKIVKRSNMTERRNNPIESDRNSSARVRGSDNETRRMHTGFARFIRSWQGGGGVVPSRTRSFLLRETSKRRGYVLPKGRDPRTGRFLDFRKSSRSRRTLVVIDRANEMARCEIRPE